MASLAVAASVAASASSLAGTRVTSRNVSTTPVVKMAAVRCEAKTDAEIMQRRAVMAAAAASLVASMSGIAFAQPTSDNKVEGEPKPGSKEARKLYKRICVTMPTAKVCHG
ncbi:hypothetical protein R1sor_021832 [Riccia sorocarpa]|uniref:Photosystem II 5 kDa protein, chloroplastic n=1 Tax=Riccia sorocarpa TaxID=122646 RepID=A0ABD3GJL6_9MARC